MPEFLIMLLLSTLLAGIVQGISGFAFAIIFLAIMQYFMPYTDLLALSSILCVIMLAVNAFVYRHHIVWKWLPVPLLINFVFTIGSIRLLDHTMDFPYWHKLLGVVFIVLALYMYFFQQKIQIHPTLCNALLFCGAGGILGGLFGVGGPPVVLYFLAIADDKEAYLSTTQMFFFINMLYDLAGRMGSGMVTPSLFRYAALCIGTILLGLWIGNKIFRHIDGNTLKKIIYLLMFLDGWYMLLF